MTKFFHSLAATVCAALPLAMAVTPAAQAESSPYHVAYAIGPDNNWGIGIWSATASSAERLALQFCDGGDQGCRLALSAPAACAGLVQSNGPDGFRYWVAYTSQPGAGGRNLEMLALRGQLMGWCQDSGAADGSCEVVDVTCLGG